MTSLLFSSGGGAILGLIIRLFRWLIEWKTKKAEFALRKTALDQNKGIPSVDFEGKKTRERRVNKSAKKIIWLFGLKFGFENEKNIYNSAWNPFNANRGMLAHAIVTTVCGISILWAVFPKVTITTLKYGEDGRIDILWGLISWPVDPGIIEVSSGSIVFGLLHLLTFIITCYFVQKD